MLLALPLGLGGLEEGGGDEKQTEAPHASTQTMARRLARLSTGAF